MYVLCSCSLSEAVSCRIGSCFLPFRKLSFSVSEVIFFHIGSYLFPYRKLFSSASEVIISRIGNCFLPHGSCSLPHQEAVTFSFFKRILSYFIVVGTIFFSFHLHAAAVTSARHRREAARHRREARVPALRDPGASSVRPGSDGRDTRVSASPHPGLTELAPGCHVRRSRSGLWRNRKEKGYPVAHAKE